MANELSDEVFGSKTDEMAEFLVKASKNMFGVDPREACPFCQKEIDPETEYQDALSRIEYGISGLCQKCQDETFG